MECPTDTVVSLFVERHLAPEASDRVEAHVDSCVSCRQLVADLARRSPDRPFALADRYELVRVLGSGGMGVVHEAKDRVLERRVAIKLLRGVESGDARTRLIREARAMAKVSSPNVVAVYDVGVIDDQVFVSMELVSGTTLRTWLGEGKRSHREVVGVFEHAGRGLMAAHACGIVHRDFKPENVLIDGERVLVADFGLASSNVAATMQDPATEVVHEPLLTVTGQIIGTPAYMSPEQLAGEPVDERSDQFSFCVALYEALFGTRPFAATTFAELSSAVLAGRAIAPPAHGPAWLRAAVMRGLARAPADRHRSMRALLDLLPRARARRQRFGIFAAAATGAILAGGIGFARTGDAPGEMCAGGEAAAAAVWNPERASAIRRALAAAKLPDAAATTALVTTRFDAWRDQLATQHRETCEATRVRGEQSAELLDLRMACLRGRASAASELLLVLETADAARVDQAISALPAATGLTKCRDAKSLLDPMRPPADPSKLAAYEAARGRVERAETRRLAGDLTTAAAMARGVRADAKTLGHRALEARAAMIEGFAQQDDLDAQLGSFDAARRLAEESADDRTRIEAGLQLVQVWEAQQKTELVDNLLKDLDAVIARLERPHDLTAHLGFQRGSILMARGDFAGARTALEAAIEVQSRAPSPSPLQIARMRGDLAMAIAQLGDIDAGIAMSNDVIATYERELGAMHPWLGEQLLARAQLAQAANRLEPARDDYKRAIAILSRSHGADGTVMARPLGSLGSVLGQLGQHEDALHALDRAVAIFEKHAGPDSHDTGVARTYRAQVLFDKGDLAGAEVEYARGLDTIAKALGADHVIVADLRATRAAKRQTAGDKRGAISDLEAALPVLEKALGAEHANLAEHRKTLAALRASPK